MGGLKRLIDNASFGPDVRLQIAACASDGSVEQAVWGVWPDNSPVRPADRFYAASLAKQVTAAAAAILVKEGRLDPDLPVANYHPGLPDWAGRITTDHLVHHTAGLPAAGALEPASDDWTEPFALAALERLQHLVFEPGTAHLYSNLGYVLLARVIARVAGQPFPSFVQTRLFEPLGLAEMGFTSDPIVDSAQIALMGNSRPLTTGDGGLWSTAGEFSRWLHHQNRNGLGISGLISSPGRLTNGDIIDYGWGLGLRSRDGQPLLVHGGQWHGCVARAVRSPSTGIAIAAMSSGASVTELTGLVDAALELFSPAKEAGRPNA